MFYKKQFAYTLSEILIAITVIGVIAAITISVLHNNIQQRINTHRHLNLVRKITKATDVMRAHGELTQFPTTMDFVNQLKKHLNIAKICDSDHINECWPTSTVIDQNGDAYIVANAKKRKDLSKGNDKEVPNVGIVLADGSALILTYDPLDKGMNLKDKLSYSTIDLPNGFETKTYAYTSNSTKGLSFVFDVNGSKGPNSETIIGSSKIGDIISFHGAHFGTGCDGTKIGGTCYFWGESVEPPINCTARAVSVAGSDSAKYCNGATGYTDDYWAGANKYCQEHGGQLIPSDIELQQLCFEHSSSPAAYKTSDRTLTVSTADKFWTGKLMNSDIYYAYSVWFTNCYGYNSAHPRSAQGWPSTKELKPFCVK